VILLRHFGRNAFISPVSTNSGKFTKIGNVIDKEYFFLLNLVNKKKINEKIIFAILPSLNVTVPVLSHPHCACVNQTQTWRILDASCGNKTSFIEKIGQSAALKIFESQSLCSISCGGTCHGL